MRLRQRTGRAGCVLTLLVALALLAPAAGVAAPTWLDEAPTRTNRDVDRGTARERFFPNDSYTGYYADPSVSLIGGVYYTTATNTGGITLPVMRSVDLTAFRPRPALLGAQNPLSAALNNDAMPQNPSWPATLVEGRRSRISLWAPSSIVALGSRYVVAYSAATRFRPHRKSCLSLAYATTPIGPFVDTRSKPLYCFDKGRLGAIDPDIHLDGRGRPWLLWKDEGIVGKRHPRLMIRRLKANGSGFKRGTRKRALLSLSARWENGVIENPSMVEYRGRTYLFYSANRWRSAGYGTGYAICRKPTGPCRKITRKRPLLSSTDFRKGSGGADAIVDHRGRLRLVHSAWDVGRVGEDSRFARRMHVATLWVTRSGRLKVGAETARLPVAPGPLKAPPARPIPNAVAVEEPSSLLLRR